MRRVILTLPLERLCKLQQYVNNHTTVVCCVETCGHPVLYVEVRFVVLHQSYYQSYSVIENISVCPELREFI